MAELTFSEFCDALKATGKEYSAMSWGGFTLFGDRQSINELNRCVHIASQEQAWRDSISDARRNAEHWRQEVGKLHSQIDRLKASEPT